MKRPSWEEYFMNFAILAATRSSCIRRQIGAIAVRDKHILATGYNGAPSGVRSCVDIGTCIREELNIPSGTQHEKCRAVHAEENLIVQAAIHGVSLLGCDIYCTTQPCILCLRKIISLKPKTVYFKDAYPDKDSADMMKEVAYPVPFYYPNEHDKIGTKWVFEY
jgi:dCMP deaminase